MSRLSQLSSFWLSSVSPQQTTEGSEQRCFSFVLRVSKTDHSSPHLASLHWLPIDSRIQYKLSSLYYNCLSSTAYLTELLRIYKPTHQLRSSSDTSILCIPTVCTRSLCQRSFSYAATAIWNTLPYEIRSSNTISFFKSSL